MSAATDHQRRQLGLALCPYCWQNVQGHWSGNLPVFTDHKNKNGSPCFGSGRVVA